jgi:thiamine-monophosphate kinase
VIRRIVERWGDRAQQIGDDAAVITEFGGTTLVVSTDASVENVHFRWEWLSPREIGYRAAAAAMSDLAAMAASPIGILGALVIPDRWRDSLDAIADGIGEAAGIAAAPILGGDMSGGAELVLAFTVLGTARRVLRRSGGKAGDRLYVTGSLGGSRAALVALEAGSEPDPSHREKFARPVPRIPEALWLSEMGASAAIDVSDGLAADLGHIAAASGVGIVVDLSALPTDRGVSPIDAAASGEEYEIAVTSPVDLDGMEFERRFGVPLTKIGFVENGPPEVAFLMEGEQVAVPSGYLHFTE